MKRKVLIMISVFLLCICGCGEKKENKGIDEMKEEITVVVEEYQNAMRSGNFDRADTYCQLENGEKGSWYFRNLELEDTENDAPMIAACKTVWRESLSITEESRETKDETVIVSTKWSACDMTALMNEGFIQKYNKEDCNQMTKEGYIELIEPLVSEYMYSWDVLITLKKMDGEWKIVEFEGFEQ